MSREGINTLAISFSSAANLERRAALLRRAIDSLACFGTPHLFRITLGPDVFVLTACPPSQVAPAGNSFVVLHGCAALCRSGKVLEAADIAAGLAHPETDTLNGLEPPYLVFFADRTGVTATTDQVGSVHLFTWGDHSCAALATSSALLARTFHVPFSFAGVFQRMTIGHTLQNATAFSDVALAPAGARARVSGGRLSIHDASTVEPGDAVEPLEGGKRCIRAAVDRCLTAVPDCGIELSGGMDSRMALAAIPHDLRQGRRAFTIGYPGSRDIEIARRLADRFSMDHVVIDLSVHAVDDADAVWRRARRIAYRDDFSTNVVDRLALDCVDDTLLGCSRIGGVNGELARGFYYPLLPVHEPVTKGAIDTLVAYRLILNDATPRALFRAQDQQSAAAALRTAVASELEAEKGPLGTALDRFYLRQRMHHWAGAGISRASMSRVILAPFFHHDYIKWTMSLPIACKQDSVGFSSVLASLDSELASIPLDTMMKPLDIAKGGASARLALFRAKARKLTFKLAQRVGHARTATVASHHFVEKLSQSELIGRVNWQGLAGTALFSDDGLEQLRTGGLPRTRASLGQVLSMHFLVEYVNATAPDRPSVTDLQLPDRGRSA